MAPSNQRKNLTARFVLAGLALALLCFGSDRSHSQSNSQSAPPPELVIQTGHASRINCAVFAPNQQWLASGSADNSIRLWDLGSGRELRALLGHRNWVNALAVSHDGEWIASGSNDQTVKLWSVVSGREILNLQGNERPVQAVALSPDNRLVVSGGADNSIRIWEVPSGRLVKAIKSHLGAVTALAFSADGKTLASGSADRSIKLWDASGWIEQKTLSKHEKKITSLSFSPDGKSLVSGSVDGAIIIWETGSGRDRLVAKGNAHALLAASFVTKDEFVSVGADGAVAAWDAASGKQKRRLVGSASDDDLLFAAISNDAALIASSTGSRQVEVRKASDGKLVQALASHATGFFSVAFSRDGRWLAAGTNDRTIRLWQIATGREMPRLSGHTGWVKAVAFSPDNRWLASGGNSGEIKLWDVNTGREIYGEAHPREIIHTVAFSPEGKWLAAAGTGQVIHLLEPSTKQTRSLSGHTGEITGIAFIPNSSLLASGSTDKTIRIWDVDKGTLVTTFPELSDQINAIAVNRDGTALAAGTADHKIELIKLTAGAGSDSRLLAGHTGEIFALAFSRDGRFLASGGSDHQVKLWNSGSGAEVRTLTGVAGDVNCLDFSSDSRSLVSANGDGSMMLWGTETGALNAVMVSLPDRDDWLVATPRGLFDGSHGAWRYLLWRFAQSTFKFAPVESFFNEFYYPGLLADVLANKNPRATLDILKKDRRQPQIDLATSANTPAGGAAERTIKIRIEVAEAPADAEHGAGSGARDLRLFRNGLLIRAWSGDVLNGAARQTIEASVPIVAGENDFSAYAFNQDNVKSNDSQLLVNGAPTLRREGAAYLIMVGVSKYANSQYNLNYSVADATEVGTELKNHQQLLGRYQPIEVISLLNEDATKANILLALRLLAGTAKGPLAKEAPADLSKIKPAQPEDAVIFYFSGHGTAQADRFYLVPHDIGYQGPRGSLDKNNLAIVLSHSISDLELEQVLKPLDADQFLLVIDACNSGQLLQATEERRGPMNTSGLAQLAYEKGMYVLTASQSDEVAFESAGLKHSYLAYALINEGIKKGAADRDHNGQVFLNEWFDYATERVPRIGTEKAQVTKELEEVDPDEKRVQRPRVFNMREGGAERFAVARLAAQALVK